MYARVLSLVCILLSAGFLLAVHVRVLYFFILVIPIWVLISFVMLRVVPYIVPPRLELRDSGSFTTLRISRAEERQHRGRRVP